MHTARRKEQTNYIIRVSVRPVGFFRTRQSKRADRIVESNDSPEIPDKGETEVPGLPSECDNWIFFTLHADGDIDNGNDVTLC